MLEYDLHEFQSKTISLSINQKSLEIFIKDKQFNDVNELRKVIEKSMIELNNCWKKIQESLNKADK